MATGQILKISSLHRLRRTHLDQASVCQTLSQLMSLHLFPTEGKKRSIFIKLKPIQHAVLLPALSVYQLFDRINAHTVLQKAIFLVLVPDPLVLPILTSRYSRTNMSYLSPDLVFPRPVCLTRSRSTLAYALIQSHILSSASVSHPLAAQAQDVAHCRDIDLVQRQGTHSS